MSQRDAGILLGVAIDRKSLGAATIDALAAIDRKREPVVFACANPHSLVEAQHDRVFKSALNSANFVVADGVGVTMMAKYARVDVGPRIAGHNYFAAVLGALEKRGAGRVFFFGSSQRVLDLISEKFKRDFPSLTLCGVLSPPYGVWSDEENMAMVATINAAHPDVLWVGMTAPKQEKWVAANCEQLDVPVTGSIGAVFDFYAGTYPRAPGWMCKLGLEWLFRLVKEPRRMWRRNFISSPKFVAMVVWRHIFGIGNQAASR
jgi:N-acetylglucosaminyldiphosphoundecaprenol N-acetyl-beta-D-mannosaminyltransferase